MAIHTIQTRQVIKATLQQAWDFFSSPRNLSRITPPEMGFTILSELPERMFAGMMIEYKVTPLFGIPLTWLTEISHLREQEYFVDEQRVGPYAIWHHEHHFKDLGGGRVEMHDRVTYAPPFGVLGELVHPFIIKPELDKIFGFRERAVQALFV
ncbi:MAG: cell division inhibitor [Verrucomicrobiaceae bacterium]|nr:cell division inhibitor [Verrucomicrobiaceae bacterium]